MLYMIVSFRNQATEDIFNGKSSKSARKLCPQSLWKVVTRKLEQLDSILNLDELKVPPGNSLENLSGDRKGGAVSGLTISIEFLLNGVNQAHLMLK